MTMLVRAFPVVKGKAEMMKFIQELQQSRAAEASAFYKRFGVSHEVVFWQDTPHGAQVIVCTEVANVSQAADEYARAEEPFETWFKQEVLRLTGIDINQTPIGPASEKIFEWPAR